MNGGLCRWWWSCVFKMILKAVASSIRSAFEVGPLGSDVMVLFNFVWEAVW